MKKVLLLMVAVMLIVGVMAGPALAVAPGEQGLERSPAFHKYDWGGGYSWAHVSGDLPRFSAAGDGGIAINATAGDHASSPIMTDRPYDTHIAPPGRTTD